VKWIALFLIIMAPMTWAQIETEKTIQESLPDASEAEARDILLHSTVLQVIEQNGAEIGIDVLAFRAKLEERFNQYFGLLKTSRLSQKFGKNYASELTEEQKKAFLDGIELTKAKEFREFSRLSSLLDSYSFKSLEKDPEGPWKGVIALNLNKSKLFRFNERLLLNEDRWFKKLFIIPEINLIGLNWSQLGLEQQANFSEPLLNSWFKRVENSAPSNLDEIVPCSKSCSDEFYRWLQIPQDQGMEISSLALNGLWLKVSFNIRKMTMRADINEWQFEWDGSTILLDANTKDVLASYDMLREIKTWRGLDQKGLNSALASALYRSALDPLDRSIRKIQESQRLNRVSRLVIHGQQNLDDVISLIELLRKEGGPLFLNPRLDNFSQKEAQLLCFYRGEEKSFIDLLSRLKELKSSQSYRIVNEFTGIHHVLKLIAQ
jgi:hypothetical protein